MTAIDSTKISHLHFKSTLTIKICIKENTWNCFIFTVIIEKLAKFGG